MLNAQFLAAAASAPAETQPTYLFVWEQLEGPGLAIIVILVLFSTCAWGVMAFKALQLRRARKYNRYSSNPDIVSGLVFGISQNAVIPPKTADLLPLSISSLCVNPGSLK